VTIGEFSTMTRLSRKALRIYHEQGLLEPAEVDPYTSYRYYDAAQIQPARVIRRLRDLDMPVPDVKAYLDARDPSARNAIVTAHLSRMEEQLRRTGDAVSSLRELLDASAPGPAIEVRNEQAELGVAIMETVTLAGVIDWWLAASRELADTLRAAGIPAVGPLSALYAHELFVDERGEVTLWLPVDSAVATAGRVTMREFPAGLFAVAVHDGPDEHLDQTYAALGGWVAERGSSTGGPVRERYLGGVLGDPGPLITEIGWPVSA
jgi:DNA-binding transcriptional MerR regulator/effector-binding domain-containing protein